MAEPQIVNISELLQLERGESVGGQLAVLLSGSDGHFRQLANHPVRVNAYTYALVLRGSALLTVDGDEYQLQQNSLCALSPLHLAGFAQASPDFQCHFLVVEKNFVDRLPDVNIGRLVAFGMNVHRQPVFTITDDESRQLHEAMTDVGRQISRRQHLRHLKLVQNALERFYLEADDVLDRRLADAAADTPVRNELLRKFMSLAMDHYRDEHLVPFYAECLHITPQYLTRIVKTATGRTVSEFILEMLYSDARNLLTATDTSVAAIAEQLQFADLASFSKFFRRHSGFSPTAFRSRKTESC